MDFGSSEAALFSAHAQKASRSGFSRIRRSFFFWSGEREPPVLSPCQKVDSAGGLLLRVLMLQEHGRLSGVRPQKPGADVYNTDTA